ncbi:MAG: UxaA family hydrolase [Gammaproteobacteria bacterium]|nr:UxaA family hydrolase [Gammaproteobacteria bacterium]
MSSAPDFLVHEENDSVGVIVVEDVTTGQELTGWIMDNDATISITVLDDIPLGHKLALNDIKDGDDVIKYGEHIGRAVADIGKGRHLHVHNLKTKKW